MTDLKILNNSDPGTATRAGGNDWDSLATYVNDISLHNPRTSTYVINQEGSTTYARHGLTNAILSSNTNPAVVIQAVFDALGITGGGVFIKQGQYTYSTKLTIPSTKDGVVLVFENPYTNWTYTGTDAALEVGDTSSQTIGFQIRNGKIECTSTSGTPVCLRLINSNHCRFYSPIFFGRTGATVTGIELNGGANFNGDCQIFGPYISNVLKGITVTNGAANAISIFGGFIGGNSGPVAGSYGIDKDSGDTWHTIGLDIENMETALRERTITSPHGSSWFDIRVEGCTNYVDTATSNNRYSGTTTTTTYTDTGSNNDFIAPNINKFNQIKTFQNYTILNGIRGGDVAITNASSPYTALATTRIIRADATSGAITINLPTAVGIAGFEYHVFRTDIAGSVNIITIDANSTQTIDSNLTCNLYAGEWVKLESDGANWQVIDRPTPSAFGYYFVKGSGPNRRYVSNQGGVSLGTSTTLPAVDTLFAFPFIVAKTTKFDTISFRITTVASAGGVARAGIYFDNGNSYPGVLLFDTGSIDITSSGGAAPITKDTTITSGLQVLQPGLYWLAWECGTAAPQLKVYSGPYNLLNLLQWDGAMSTVNVSTGWSVAHTFGALPNPYSAGGTVLAGTVSATVPYPAVGLRPI